MQIELQYAIVEDKPVLCNLTELYLYDLSEFNI